MLSSISPLGEWGRQVRWGTTALIYSFGSIAGGGVVGLALGGLSNVVRTLTPSLSHGMTLAAVSAVCVLGAVADMLRRRVSVPGVRRQVNENWLNRYRRWVYSVGFGFQLGIGVITIVTSASVYVYLLLAYATGSLLGGAVVGITFGLARALVIWTVARASDPIQLMRVHTRVEQLEPWANRGAIVALLAAGGVAVAATAAYG